MATQLDRLAANTAVIKGLQLTTLSSLAVVSGIASSLYVWVIPIIQKAPDASTQITQFNLMIEKGTAYLMPTSRILAGSLASLTLLFYRNPNPMISARWKYYGLALACLVPAIPWELKAIFPTNDRMEEIGENFEDSRTPDSGKGDNAEVERLLLKWQRRHIVRIVCPAAAFLVTLWNVITEQSL